MQSDAPLTAGIDDDWVCCVVLFRAEHCRIVWWPDTSAVIKTL